MHLVTYLHPRLPTDSAEEPVFIALAFYFGVVFVFRRMAKADPDMTRVWRRHMGYKSFYRARSPFWAREGYRK